MNTLYKSSLTIACFAILLMLVSGCASRKNRTSNNDNYQSNITQSSVRYSEIHIPFSVKKSVLSELMNIALDSLLQSGVVGAIDGMNVQIERADNTIIEASEKDILASIPLKITVIKKVLIANVKAEGVVNLMTSTGVEIDEFWNIDTQTELIDYQWIEPMRISGGMGGFSVESIANNLIENSKESFTKQIDEALSNQLKIQDKVDQLSKQIRNPIKIDEPYNGFIQLSPDTVKLAGFQNKAEDISNVISININSKLHSSEPSNNIFKGLPRFEWSAIEGDSSTLALPAEITYQQIEDVLGSYVIGQTFTDGSRSVTVNTLKIKGSGRYLQTIANVSGSFNGELVINGIPEYDKDKNLLYMKNIDIKVQTRNVLQQAAAWLAKGIIKRKLEEQLQFSLADQVKEIQSVVDKNIESMVKSRGVDLSVQLDKIDIDEFLLLQDYIQATMLIDAKISVEVNSVPDIKF